MGGVFSSPKEVEVPIYDNADKQAEEERRKALARQRRGLEGTINTSYRGLLTSKDLKRKKLLGE